MAWLAGLVGSVIWAVSPAWAQSPTDRDSFFLAVTDGKAAIVRACLEKHPDWAYSKFYHGMTPVYRASVLGRSEVLNVLLSAGADPNAVTDRGTSALCAAAMHGDLDIGRLLFAAGAKVDTADANGQTPLMMAVRRGHVAFAQALIDRGASVVSFDRFGRGPLHYAAGSGSLELTRLLLAHGAPWDRVDKLGFSALGWCRYRLRNDHALVAKELLEKGALDIRPAGAWNGVPSKEQAL